MKKFFNDYLNLPHIWKEKKEYRQHMARVKRLPDEYRYVFEKIQTYMWELVCGSGMEMMKVQEELLCFFEESVEEGISVHEAMGDDVELLLMNGFAVRKRFYRSAGIGSIVP